MEKNNFGGVSSPRSELKKIIIYTDGGCSGNPGPGGWAAILKFDTHTQEISGGEPITTNNRMELQAAIAALATLDEPCDIELFTDSDYLKNGITKWMRNWKARGWLTVEKTPVKNEDLWRQLDQLAVRHRITWKWVKGHAGHVENERCDQLAGNEIAKIRTQYSRKQVAVLRNEFKSNPPAKPQQGTLF